MKAITVWQPWASLTADGGKDIENRGWKPPKAMIGERVAIHAAARFEPGEEGEDLSNLLDSGHFEPGSVGYAVIDALYDGLTDARNAPRGAIVAVATLAEVLEYGVGRISTSPWYCGPIGWRWADVRSLTSSPIPCKGKQGLWTLPADVEAAIPINIRFPHLEG